MTKIPPHFDSPALKDDKIGPWLMLVLGVIGLSLLVVTAVGLWRRSQAAGDWVAATGRVVGFEEITLSRGAQERAGDTPRPGRVDLRSSYPIIEFSDTQGNLHRFVSRLGAIDGTVVELAVRYRGSNPNEAEVVHGFAQWGWMLVTGGLGVLLMALGYFIRDKL